MGDNELNQNRRDERIFQARLAYEKNCIAKYDYPDYMNRPSRPPKHGDRMQDYAIRYNVTVDEMMDYRVLDRVEQTISKK